MTDAYVIIAKENCPYCVKAKTLLDRMGKEAVTLDVMEYPVLRTFLKSQGLNTVPQVFHRGRRIGGYEDLAEVFGEQLALFDE